MMNIDNIFVNVLAHAKLNVDNNEILKYCNSIQDNDPGRKISNEGGYQSNFFDMSTVKPLATLHKQITENVTSLHDYMGFNQSLKKVVDLAWVNINPPRTYNATHTHSGGIFTAIYYVKVPENSGNLQLDNPISPFNFVISSDQIDIPNQFNNSTTIVQPKEQHLYVFPCWIAHSVHMNLSDETRISIAFDVAIKSE